MEIGSRKSSSGAGSEKMERVGDRHGKIKGYCSIVRQAKAHSGLECQWKEEEEEEEDDDGDDDDDATFQVMVIKKILLSNFSSLLKVSSSALSNCAVT
jgi:hypothetical protein